MDNKSEVLNAQITKTFLGYEDHEILTFGLYLNISGGRGCMFGGYSLDEYDKEIQKRVSTAESMELISQILKVVGVNSWEALKNKYIRVVSNGCGTSIKKIGNLMNDDWLDIDVFFKKYE